MVRTESSSLAVGMSAPAFTLPDTVSESSVSLSDFTGQPVLIVFMCNHCPYVVHIVDELARAASEFANQGVATVAISANDVTAYPADSPENMAQLARQKQFGFPYLYDESQAVAQDYGAVCTPDIYLFDSDHRLYYHGQFDSTRPGKGKSSGEDLRAAVDDLLSAKPAPADPAPSVGCSIKWKVA